MNEINRLSTLSTLFFSLMFDFKKDYLFLYFFTFKEIVCSILQVPFSNDKHIFSNVLLWNTDTARTVFKIESYVYIFLRENTESFSELSLKIIVIHLCNLWCFNYKHFYAKKNPRFVQKEINFNKPRVFLRPWTTTV